MSNRRQARELALQILFQIEFAPRISLNEFIQIFQTHVDGSSLSFAQSLVEGVVSHKDELDQRIQSASSHWKLDRMATIDRNVLRLAVFEMLHSTENLTPAIVMNEAIEISKKFGSEESGAFVNGILNQISRTLR